MNHRFPSCLSPQLNTSLHSLVAVLHSYVQAIQFGVFILCSHISSILQQEDCSSVMAAPAGKEQRGELGTRDDAGNARSLCYPQQKIVVHYSYNMRGRCERV